MPRKPSLRARISRAYGKYATVAGLKQEGFFVKYLYAGSLPQEQEHYPAVEAVFRRHHPAIEAFLDSMEGFGEIFRSFGSDPGDPEWGVGRFPALDGAAAYTVVQREKPKRILEVGSGDSTRFLLRAARDLGNGCTVTCIDPMPRREIASLGIAHVPRVLRKSDSALLEQFEPGDIFFIDSSHVLATGTDVDIEFNHLFPSLPSGSIVHVHDVFLPHGYPPEWRERWYSEQNALIPWLVSGWLEPLYPGHYATRAFPERIRAILAGFHPEGGSAGSIWLRRR